MNAVSLGGGQENGLRSGTENVPLIVGFARALSLAQEQREKEFTDMTVLRDLFLKTVQERCPSVVVNTDLLHATPHILNLAFLNLSSEQIVIEADINGVGISAGSACTQRQSGVSHVVAQLPGGGTAAASSIRISFGRETTKQDATKAAGIIALVVDKLSTRNARIE